MSSIAGLGNGVEVPRGEDEREFAPTDLYQICSFAFCGGCQPERTVVFILQCISGPRLHSLDLTDMEQKLQAAL